MGKCEHCDTRSECFTTPSGHALCFECCSEFISWVLNGGMVEDPEAWAWAMEEDDGF